jgi:hypothetical protein
MGLGENLQGELSGREWVAVAWLVIGFVALPMIFFNFVLCLGGVVPCQKGRWKDYQRCSFL